MLTCPVPCQPQCVQFANDVTGQHAANVAAQAGDSALYTGDGGRPGPVSRKQILHNYLADNLLHAWNLRSSQREAEGRLPVGDKTSQSPGRCFFLCPDAADASLLNTLQPVSQRTEIVKDALAALQSVQQGEITVQGGQCGIAAGSDLAVGQPLKTALNQLKIGA